jgi:transposase
MRGEDNGQSSMLVLLSPESLVPGKHPVREIKRLADECLETLTKTFDVMYARGGRPSIPPERLLKSMLLMALYSVPSERMFCERLRYDLLFRWFLDMSMVDEVFDASSFSKNRERLMEHEVAHQFLQAVVTLAKKKRLMSESHFSVDGTLIEAWASMKSFRLKDDEKDDGDGNGWANFKGEKRSNKTHESKTDGEAKLLRKGNGREAKLVFAQHVLMENRNGLIVDTMLEKAVGTTEPHAAIELVKRAKIQAGASVGADRGYDTKFFSQSCRALGIKPHAAQCTHRQSSIDKRTTKHNAYHWSQIARRKIESIFGWEKTVGGCRKSKYRGVAKNNFFTNIVAAAYNLLRIRNLLAA